MLSSWLHKYGSNNHTAYDLLAYTDEKQIDGAMHVAVWKF